MLKYFTEQRLGKYDVGAGKADLVRESLGEGDVKRSRSNRPFWKYDEFGVGVGKASAEVEEKRLEGERRELYRFVPEGFAD
jgi:hypothetical protein